MTERGYQYGFSSKGEAMFNVHGRQRKAVTMVKVISNYYYDGQLRDLDVLNVGGSAGIIDEYLSRHFKSVTGVDIDEKAIAYANDKFQKDNLSFKIDDAMNLSFEDSLFDVVICSQVYEHVQDAGQMMSELHRVLKPGGIVYFAAGNRLMFNKPHYNLPLLSVIPRWLANYYLKLAGKGNYYYEKHFTYWGLSKLVSRFSVIDYTLKILNDPDKYSVEYMVKPDSMKQKIAIFMARYLKWLVPAYIWLLRKD